MTLSRSVHFAANGIISFFLRAEKYSVVCMYHILIIHSRQWTFRLLPRLGHCEQCFGEQLGCACPFGPRFSPGMCPGVGVQGPRAAPVIL